MELADVNVVLVLLIGAATTAAMLLKAALGAQAYRRWSATSCWAWRWAS